MAKQILPDFFFPQVLESRRGGKKFCALAGSLQNLPPALPLLDLNEIFYFLKDAFTHYFLSNQVFY